jgi:hypothetical protein
LKHLAATSQIFLFFHPEPPQPFIPQTLTGSHFCGYLYLAFPAIHFTFMPESGHNKPGIIFINSTRFLQFFSVRFYNTRQFQYPVIPNQKQQNNIGCA